MENASKALIMAASVLLAIMIIALGVTIFNKAEGTASTINLDATEISMINSKFENYEGTQSGSQVKSLISALISNASANSEDLIKVPSVNYIDESSEEKNVFVKGENGENLYGGKYISVFYLNPLSKIRALIKSTHTYTVKLDYGTSGLIEKITINY